MFAAQTNNRESSELIWSAPAKRSDDGALEVSHDGGADESKAVSRCACHRTPNVARLREVFIPPIETQGHFVLYQAEKSTPFLDGRATAPPILSPFEPNLPAYYQKTARIITVLISNRE